MLHHVHTDTHLLGLTDATMYVMTHIRNGLNPQLIKHTYKDRYKNPITYMFCILGSDISCVAMFIRAGLFSKLDKSGPPGPPRPAKLPRPPVNNPFNSYRSTLSLQIVIISQFLK